ncbi:hypothetical protein H0H87_008297, partial [Tephrocybe sp. NHM501043]
PGGCLGEQEKERLKERELEHHTAQTSKGKFSLNSMPPQQYLSQGSASDVEMLLALPSFKKCKAHNTTSPQATLGDLPVLKKL